MEICILQVDEKCIRNLADNLNKCTQKWACNKCWFERGIFSNCVYTNSRTFSTWKTLYSFKYQNKNKIHPNEIVMMCNLCTVVSLLMFVLNGQNRESIHWILWINTKIHKDTHTLSRIFVRNEWVIDRSTEKSKIRFMIERLLRDIATARSPSQSHSSEKKRIFRRFHRRECICVKQ